MKVILILLLCFIYFRGFTQVPQPTYDKAKHYQWRSMEIGPRKYSPSFYYRIMHNNYRKKYNPNIDRRTLTTGSSLLENNEYEKQKEELEEWEHRELLLAAQRRIDLVEGVLGDKINNAKDRYIENMKTYSALASSFAKFEDIQDAIVRGARINDEFYRQLENLEIVQISYIDNSKRTDGYIEIAQNLDELNEQLIAITRLMYNKKVNFNFLKSK